MMHDRDIVECNIDMMQQQIRIQDVRPVKTLYDVNNCRPSWISPRDTSHQVPKYSNWNHIIQIYNSKDGITIGYLIYLQHELSTSVTP